MTSFAAHLAAARARREQPAPVAEVVLARVSTEPPTGELWSSRFTWVRDLRAPWGRRATVQEADGALRFGYLVPPDFEAPDEWDLCLVYEGREVYTEWKTVGDRAVLQVYTPGEWARMQLARELAADLALQELEIVEEQERRKRRAKRGWR